MFVRDLSLTHNFSILPTCAYLMLDVRIYDQRRRSQWRSNASRDVTNEKK